MFPKRRSFPTALVDHLFDLGVVDLPKKGNIRFLQLNRSPHHVVEAFSFKIVVFHAVNDDARKPLKSGLYGCVHGTKGNG